MSDQANQKRNPDHPIGPKSVQGLEASELGDERGNVDTDPRKVVTRKLPQNTGGQPDGDVGMRAKPDSAEADDHGHL